MNESVAWWNFCNDGYWWKFVFPALARLEGSKWGMSSLLSGPLAPDPVLHPDCYSARASVRRPRISANAAHILEKGQTGVMRELLNVDCFPVTEITKPSKPLSSHIWTFSLIMSTVSWYFGPSEEPEFDFRKDNIRRLRDIQRRCKEVQAEKSRSTPVKALWTSTKYHNIQSKFLIDLQVTIASIKKLEQHTKDRDNSILSSIFHTIYSHYLHAPARAEIPNHQSATRYGSIGRLVPKSRDINRLHNLRITPWIQLMLITFHPFLFLCRPPVRLWNHIVKTF